MESQALKGAISQLIFLSQTMLLYVDQPIIASARKAPLSLSVSLASGCPLLAKVHVIV